MIAFLIQDISFPPMYGNRKLYRKVCAKTNRGTKKREIRLVTKERYASSATI